MPSPPVQAATQSMQRSQSAESEPPKFMVTILVKASGCPL